MKENEVHPLLNYNKGTMPDGWGLVRHAPGKIIVTHRDGSGIVLQENSELVSESLFYRMMDQILLCK